MPKNILIISPAPTHPGTAGNEARVLSIAKTLMNDGHCVHFLFSDRQLGNYGQMEVYWGERFYPVPFKRANYRRDIIHIALRFINGERRSIDRWYGQGIDEAIDKIKQKIMFDVVIVEYVILSRALLRFGPEVLKVIDTIDVFSDRHKNMAKSGLKPDWYSTTRKEEGRGLDRANVVMAITSEDRDALLKITKSKIVEVSHILNACKSSNNRVSDKKILFVGSLNPMNLQAIVYFADKVLPLVKEKHPQAEFIIAGSVCKKLGNRPEWLKAGVVDDLEPLYNSASVVINPMLYGTGLNIKSIDALCRARPLVTTTVGARGLMEGAGKAFLVGDGPDSFAANVIKLLNDDFLSESLSKNAYDFALAWNRRNIEALRSIIAP